MLDNMKCSSSFDNTVFATGLSFEVSVIFPFLFLHMGSSELSVSLNWVQNCEQCNNAHIKRWTKEKTDSPATSALQKYNRALDFVQGQLLKK